MDKSAADAYVYAKASGMLAKSFVGSRTIKLFSVNSLQELWTLVFSTEVPAIPEVLLAKKIEQEAESKFLKEYISLLKNYSNPEQILIDILRFYDYDNLKDIVASLCVAKTSGKTPELPALADIGDYSKLNIKAWPNLAKITESSDLSWYNRIPDFDQQQELDSKLDLQFIRKLWESMHDLPGSSVEPVSSLLKEEMILNNIMWSIRLRVYYGMDKEQVISKLMTVKDVKKLRDIKADPLAGPVIKTLDWDIESYSDWAKWKYSDLLNPHEEGVVWKIDPRWVQQSAKTAFNAKALRQFRKHPFTANVLVTWFKIKQYELDCIRTAAEGLRLNVAQDIIQEFAGLSSV